MSTFNRQSGPSLSKMMRMCKAYLKDVQHPFHFTCGWRIPVTVKYNAPPANAQRYKL